MMMKRTVKGLVVRSPRIAPFSIQTVLTYSLTGVGEAPNLRVTSHA